MKKDTQKDVFQKAKAISYCLSTGLVPFLNVPVAGPTELSGTEYMLTDIDVLGIQLDTHGKIGRIFFDCKTVRTSPINRAFWAAGLLRFLAADEVFVILRDAAVESHRLAAKQINVHLFDERLFDAYAESNTLDNKTLVSYQAEMANWMKFQDLAKNWTWYSPFFRMCEGEACLARDLKRSLRIFLTASRALTRELNPDRDEHMAMFAQGVATVAILLVPIVGDFRNLFDPKTTEKEFGGLLRNYIWGGVENYSIRYRLSKMIAQLKGNGEADFELPEWVAFVHLIRSLLDAPTAIADCALPCRELAFRYIAAEHDEQKDRRLRELFVRNSRVRQFLFAIAKYIVAAAGLPRDTQERFERDVNAIIEELKA